jgi:hypothetical protein
MNYFKDPKDEMQLPSPLKIISKKAVFAYIRLQVLLTGCNIVIDALIIMYQYACMDRNFEPYVQ